MITALAAVGSVVASLRNARKIDEVHKIADGLSEARANAAAGEATAVERVKGLVTAAAVLAETNGKH